MAFEELPREFKDGDPLEPWHLNALFGELRRWRKLRGSGGVVVSGADGPNPPRVHSEPAAPFFIRVTGAYAAGYPWEQVLITAGRAVVATGVTGSAAADPAFELQKGDTTLTADGTVYEARRSPASHQLLFDGKN